MKRKNATVSVPNNKATGTVKLTPHAAAKVRTIRFIRGQATCVYLRSGLRIVPTTTSDNMLDWRRPDLIAHTEGGIGFHAARIYSAHAFNAHLLVVQRHGTRQTTDAELERAIVSANIGLCYCNDCRAVVDVDHPNHEGNDDGAPPRDVLRSFPDGRTMRITAATYVLRWNLALANGLAVSPHGNNTRVGAVIVDDAALDRILAGDYPAPEAVTPEVTPDAEPVPVVETVAPTAADLRAREPAPEPEPAPVLVRLSVVSDGSTYQCVRAPACPCVACRDADPVTAAIPAASYSWGE
jgi:hypothetical protein